MSWIAKEFFEASPMLVLPVVALILFVTVFLGLSLKTLLMKRGEADRHAHLALEGEGPLDGAHEEVSRG